VLTKILIASRSAAAVQALQAAFTSSNEFECRTRVLTNGHTDPLYGLEWDPDIVLLRFDAEHLAEIASWAETPESRPPLVVIGPPGNVEAMRIAIRSGARDFLPEPVKRSELLASLKRVQEELAKRTATKSAGVMTTFVGAAGGVGTSLIATNVAQMLAAAGHLSTVMVDLDLNYASLSHLLDLHFQNGLLEALDAVDTLDAHALQGFGAIHKSGLKLLGTTATRAVLSKDVSAERMSSLLAVLRTHHSHVVVDVPHVLDGLNAMVFGASSAVHVVLQQSVLHVRNAARLSRILREEIGISRNRIKFVLNRHSKDATVDNDDVRRALDVEELYVVPSHYRSALQSIDAGIPLYESSRTAPVVARGLMQIYAELSGQKPDERGSFLKRALPSFMRD
jgi:pilus assembly protein CpaE